MTRKAAFPNTAPATDRTKNTKHMAVRARGPGDQRGNTVWPKVSADNAPQYKFMALAAATATENTMSTSGAMLPVSEASPAIKLPLGAASPTNAPNTMGRNEPSTQPQ